MLVRYNINNGNSITDLKDWQVSDLFVAKIEKISTQMFSSVHAYNIQYRFPGTMNEQRARKIVFKRSTLSVAWECVRAFFVQLFSPSSCTTRYRDKPQILNGQLVAALLASDPTLVDEDSIKRAESDLKALYYRCETLTIIISDDCNHLDAEPLVQNSALINTRNTAATIRKPVDNSCLIS